MVLSLVNIFPYSVPHRHSKGTLGMQVMLMSFPSITSYAESVHIVMYK